MHAIDLNISSITLWMLRAFCMGFLIDSTHSVLGVSITEFKLNEAGVFEIHFESKENFYYALFTGSTADRIDEPVSLSWDNFSAGVFIDTERRSSSLTRFFKIHEYRYDQSGDVDGDGIPDLIERDQPELDPLNGLDAGEDPDLDGASTREEYQLGTDPFISDVVYLDSTLDELNYWEA